MCIRDRSQVVEAVDHKPSRYEREEGEKQHEGLKSTYWYREKGKGMKVTESASLDDSFVQSEASVNVF